MEFSKFCDEVMVLNKKNSTELREKYVAKFVNVNHELFHEQIQSRHKFVDGYCYLGYLWDYIINPVVIPETDFVEMAKKFSEIYVFWDIHSCERIFIKDYWKFEKEAMLKMKIETLLQGEKYLPEDIYIFDESFNWTLIKTHEYTEKTRFCLMSGKI